MKLESSEVFTVTPGGKTFGSRAEALAAIDGMPPGTYSIAMTERVLATGAGIEPGKPAVGGPAVGKAVTGGK
jgi:hypothetical protein